jgi:hypothetical protein
MSKLRHQPEPLFRGETSGDPVDLEDKRIRQIKGLQRAMVSHESQASSLKPCPEAASLMDRSQRYRVRLIASLIVFRK